MECSLLHLRNVLLNFRLVFNSTCDNFRYWYILNIGRHWTMNWNILRWTQTWFFLISHLYQFSRLPDQLDFHKRYGKLQLTCFFCTSTKDHANKWMHKVGINLYDTSLPTQIALSLYGWYCIYHCIWFDRYPTQRPVTRRFDIFFAMRLNKRLRNNRETGHLRRYRAHYDVSVMMYLVSVYNGLYHIPRSFRITLVFAWLIMKAWKKLIIALLIRRYYQCFCVSLSH